MERLIRTCRVILQRHFVKTGTRQWLDRLDKFLKSYNNRPHSTTKLRPLDLVNDPLLVVNPKTKPTKIVQLPPIGSFVRLNRLRHVFEKEASGTWSEEIFQVVSHKISQKIPMITVKDLSNEPVKGALYPEEYLSVHWNGKRTISQVHEQVPRKGSQPPMQLVSFIEYPPKYKKWIPVE